MKNRNLTLTDYEKIVMQIAGRLYAVELSSPRAESDEGVNYSEAQINSIVDAFAIVDGVLETTRER